MPHEQRVMIFEVSHPTVIVVSNFYAELTRLVPTN